MKVSMVFGLLVCTTLACALAVPATDNNAVNNKQAVKPTGHNPLYLPQTDLVSIIITILRQLIEMAIKFFLGIGKRTFGVNNEEEIQLAPTFNDLYRSKHASAANSIYGDGTRYFKLYNQGL